MPKITVVCDETAFSLLMEQLARLQSAAPESIQDVQLDPDFQTKDKLRGDRTAYRLILPRDAQPQLTFAPTAVKLGLLEKVKAGEGTNKQRIWQALVARYFNNLQKPEGQLLTASDVESLGIIKGSAYVTLRSLKDEGLVESVELAR